MVPVRERGAQHRRRLAGPVRPGQLQAPCRGLVDERPVAAVDVEDVPGPPGGGHVQVQGTVAGGVRERRRRVPLGRVHPLDAGLGRHVGERPGAVVAVQEVGQADAGHVEVDVAVTVVVLRGGARHQVLRGLQRPVGLRLGQAGGVGGVGEAEVAHHRRVDGLGVHQCGLREGPWVAVRVEGTGLRRGGRPGRFGPVAAVPRTAAGRHAGHDRDRDAGHDRCPPRTPARPAARPPGDTHPGHGRRVPVPWPSGGPPLGCPGVPSEVGAADRCRRGCRDRRAHGLRGRGRGAPGRLGPTAHHHGGAPGTTTPAPAATTSPDGTTVATGFPEDWTPPTLRWRDCDLGVDARCATLTVPARLGRPGGTHDRPGPRPAPRHRRPDRSAAHQPRRTGSGPGLEFLFYEPFSDGAGRPVRHRRAGTRGAWASSHRGDVRRAPSTDFLDDDPDPDDAAEQAALDAAAAAVSAECADRRTRTLLPHVGTDGHGPRPRGHPPGAGRRPG